MLQLSSSIINQNIFSLRTSRPVASGTAPIINPNNLKIEGFYCTDTIDAKHELVMLYQDIRELLPQGFVINDHDVLAEPNELARLRDILQLNFELIGKPVVTTTGSKVGKVSDFATETESMFIQKLYVSQSIFRNLTGGNLAVDRTQIVEITPKRIVVQDLHGRVPAHARATA